MCNESESIRQYLRVVCVCVMYVEEEGVTMVSQGRKTDFG